MSVRVMSATLTSWEAHLGHGMSMRDPTAAFMRLPTHTKTPIDAPSRAVAHPHQRAHGCVVHYHGDVQGSPSVPPEGILLLVPTRPRPAQRSDPEDRRHQVGLRTSESDAVA